MSDINKFSYVIGCVGLSILFFIPAIIATTVLANVFFPNLIWSNTVAMIINCIIAFLLSLTITYNALRFSRRIKMRGDIKVRGSVLGGIPGWRFGGRNSYSVVIAAGVGLIILLLNFLNWIGRLICGKNLIFKTPASEKETDRYHVLLERAAEGDPIAQYKVGKLYVEAKGIPQDWEEAYLWLSLAAKNKIHDAVILRDKASEQLTDQQKFSIDKRVTEWK